MQQATVAIVGGGQLAQMMALAGRPLGIKCRILDPNPDACAGGSGELLLGAYDDSAMLRQLVEGADVVTFDFENVPASALAEFLPRVAIYPPPGALETAQDRWLEKQLFGRLGIPTPPSRPVDSLTELEAAVAAVGLPAVVKTRRLGYDGKGQYRLNSERDLATAWRALGGVPAIVEAWVAFEREVSCLAVAGSGGQQRFYPLAENHHRDGILRLSIAPYDHPELCHQAQEYLRRLIAALDYRGVLAVEFFVVDGQLMANEMAPRVHNSGHWSQEGAVTCQFENHLRAVLGWPLGSTAARGVSAMVNLIGAVPRREALLAQPTLRLHLYGKAPRAGRKLGHLNFTAASREELCHLGADLCRGLRSHHHHDLADEIEQLFSR